MNWLADEQHRNVWYIPLIGATMWIWIMLALIHLFVGIGGIGMTVAGLYWRFIRWKRKTKPSAGSGNVGATPQHRDTERGDGRGAFAPPLPPQESRGETKVNETEKVYGREDLLRLAAMPPSLKVYEALGITQEKFHEIKDKEKARWAERGDADSAMVFVEEMNVDPFTFAEHIADVVIKLDRGGDEASTAVAARILLKCNITEMNLPAMITMVAVVQKITKQGFQMFKYLGKNRERLLNYIHPKKPEKRPEGSDEIQ
jgi:hypothetical protein